MTETLPFKHFDWIGNAVLNNVQILERALEIIREYGPFDVLSIHDWLGSNAAKAIRQAKKMPLVLTLHDTEVGKRNSRLTPSQTYIAEMESWISSIADKIIVCSEFMKKEVEKHYNIDLKKVSVVPCGVNSNIDETGKTDLQEFRKLFARPEERIIGFVGRLSHVKGPYLILENAARILKKKPDAKFVFAGEGYLKQKLLTRAAELGLSDRVVFPGHLSGRTLAAFYKVVDLLVVPSVYEPFGLVALEGVACGVPVITSDIGGLAEVTKKGGFGISVPSEDMKFLRKAILDGLDMLHIHRDKAKSLQDKVKNAFSWRTAAEKTLEVYQSAIEKNQMAKTIATR